MEHEMMEHSEILLYSDENGKEFVNVVFMDETFWLTQVGMAELFDSSKSNISEHLSHIFEEEELDKGSCMRKFGISEFSPFNKKGDTKYYPNCGGKSEDDEDDGI